MFGALEEVFIKDLIPMIDATYRTKTDRESRALAGLSSPAFRRPERSELAKAGTTNARTPWFMVPMRYHLLVLEAFYEPMKSQHSS